MRMSVVIFLAVSFLNYPGLAKFNKPDPERDWDWENPASINLYQYVRNNPISSYDPTGFSEKTVEKILTAVDGTLNKAHQLGRKSGGHEMAFFIKKKRGEIRTTGIERAQDPDKGTITARINKKKFLGLGHTHHEENGHKNTPPSDTDLLAIATEREETVNIVQGDSIRYVAESNDPGKAREYLESLGENASGKIEKEALTYYREYKENNPSATYQEAHEYAILKIAERLGVKIYVTQEGEDQTDVTEVKAEDSQRK